MMTGRLRDSKQIPASDRSKRETTKASTDAAKDKQEPRVRPGKRKTVVTEKSRNFKVVVSND
jgi:hypothetical protein